MGLTNLKSRFDRHKIQLEAIPPAELSGQTVGGPNDPQTGPNPDDGDYFRGPDRLAKSDSPFDSDRGDKMDQMVKLLNDPVISNNHPYLPTGIMTYSPHLNTVLPQDMNGNDYGNDFANPLTGNYMGRYKNPDTDAIF